MYVQQMCRKVSKLALKQYNIGYIHIISMYIHMFRTLACVHGYVQYVYIHAYVHMYILYLILCVHTYTSTSTPILLLVQELRDIHVDNCKLSIVGDYFVLTLEKESFFQRSPEVVKTRKVQSHRRTKSHSGALCPSIAELTQPLKQYATNHSSASNLNEEEIRTNCGNIWLVLRVLTQRTRQYVQLHFQRRCVLVNMPTYCTYSTYIHINVQICLSIYRMYISAVYYESSCYICYTVHLVYVRIYICTYVAMYSI